MKKFIFVIFSFVFSNNYIYSQINFSNLKFSENSDFSLYKSGLIDEILVNNTRLKNISAKALSTEKSNGLYGLGMGICLDLKGLALFDNYPSSGLGFELGLSQIYSGGFSLNCNVGGASNDWLWLGMSVGYTHGLYKLAPYGRIGFAITYEALEDDGLAGYLEFGTYIKLTEWLSFNPGARFALIKTYNSWQSTHYGLLMLGFTIDPFLLIPYKSY